MLEWRRVGAMLLAYFWLVIHFFLIYKKHHEIQKIRLKDDKYIRRNMIKTSVALNYYVFNKKYFSDYKKYI